MFICEDHSDASIYFEPVCFAVGLITVPKFLPWVPTCHTKVYYNLQLCTPQRSINPPLWLQLFWHNPSHAPSLDFSLATLSHAHLKTFCCSVVKWECHTTISVSNWHLQSNTSYWVGTGKCILELQCILQFLTIGKRLQLKGLLFGTQSQTQWSPPPPLNSNLEVVDL